MNINLHIERLVLEGFKGGAREGALIETAVQAELTRLWSQTATSSMPQTSTAAPTLRGAAIGAGAAASPSLLGGAIAQSVYGAIAK